MLISYSVIYIFRKVTRKAKIDKEIGRFFVIKNVTLQKISAMTRQLAIYTLYIIILLSATCCNQSNRKGIEFERKGAQEKLKTAALKDISENSWMDENEMEFDVKVDIDFLQATDRSDSAVCATINNYIITQLLGQDATMDKDTAVQRYITMLKREFKQDDSPTCYDHITGVAEYGREGIINYTFTEDYYGGGAHPTQGVTIKRFNAYTGTQLGVWDIFVDSCSNSIKDMLTDKLMQQQKVNTIEELQELGYLDMMDMFITDNFWLRKDSVTFFFNEYDIAPYACGQTIISLSYDELKGMMK